MAIRSRSATARLAAVLGLLALGIASDAYADNAYWQGRRSSDWSHGISAGVSNWYSASPAQGGRPLEPPSLQDAAVFAQGARRFRIVIPNGVVAVAAVVITGSPTPITERYTFAIDGILSIRGHGLLNHSAAPPIFNVRPKGVLTLLGGARLLSYTAAEAAVINLGEESFLSLQAQSGGGDAVVNNAGGTVRFGTAGPLGLPTASAQTMKITNEGRSQAPYSRTEFLGRSTGGNALLINQNNGIVDFTRTLGPAGNGRVHAGKIANFGDLYIGTRSLTLSDAFIQRQGSAHGDLYVTVFRQQTGSIAVAKRALLGGTLRVDVREPVRGKPYTVLTAAGGLVGRFDEVSAINVNMPHPIAVYTPKSVILYFNP